MHHACDHELSYHAEFNMSPEWHESHATPTAAEHLELDPGWELAELADFFGVDEFI